MLTHLQVPRLPWAATDVWLVAQNFLKAVEDLSVKNLFVVDGVDVRTRRFRQHIFT